MGIFDSVFNVLGSLSSITSSDPFKSGAIDYGKQKKDGGHDHRYNTGDDRTPAQKAGDKKKNGKSGGNDE